MMTVETRDWDRYALISHLAKKLGGNGRLGKKALQKYIYLIQELENVPVGYKYDFYTYGPYSRDLSGDLDIVDFLCGVIINYDQPSNSYSIITGEYCADFHDRGKEYLDQFGGKIDRIINKFGGRLAKDLELTATIVYVNKEQTALEVHTLKDLIDKVRKIKPKFQRQKILNSVKELEQEGYLML